MCFSSVGSLPRTKGNLPVILSTTHSILNSFQNFFHIYKFSGYIYKVFLILHVIQSARKISHGKNTTLKKIPPNKKQAMEIKLEIISFFALPLQSGFTMIFFVLNQRSGYLSNKLIIKICSDIIQ